MFRTAILLGLFLWSGLCSAGDYTILLNKRDTQFGYNNNGPGDNDFNLSKPWRTWGTTAHDVANFHNGSSHSIAGIWFKALHSGHTFSIDSSGGGLFGEVWVNQDRTEIIFKHVTIPVASGDYFWMKAVPATGVMGESYYQFSAKMFENDPEVPTTGGWHKLENKTSAPINPGVYVASACQPCCCCVRPKCGILRRRARCR